jgi:hypothetical protein
MAGQEHESEPSSQDPGAPSQSQRRVAPGVGQRARPASERAAQFLGPSPRRL